MKKKLMFMFAIFMMAGFVKAQTTFEMTYDNGSEDVGISVLELTDGYLMCGALKDDVNGDYDVFVTKVSLTGDEVWTKIYSDVSPGDDYATYMSSSTDGNFVITGTTKNIDDENDDVFVIKISADGTEIWKNIYDGGNSEDDGALYITESLSGNYLICGYSFDGDDSDMWVFEIEQDGKFVGDNFYGLAGNNKASCVIEFDDGSLAIIGQSYDNVNKDLDGVLIKTDINGDEDWSYYTTGTGNEVFNDFIIDENGDYVLVGAEEDPINGDNDLLLEKVSADGKTTIYSYKFDYSEGNDEAVRIYITDTECFIAGYVEDTENNDNDAYLASVDTKTGTIIGDVLYGGSYEDKFYDFSITSDKGFICVGSQEDANGGVDVYLVKTDDDGEIPTGIHTASSNSLSINVYPNPALNYLHIETSSNNISTYSIEDITGRIVLSGEIKSDINVSELKEGIYFVKITTDKGEIITKKIIKKN